MANNGNDTPQAVKLSNLRERYVDLQDDYDTLEKRVRELEISHGRMSERTTLFQLGQIMFTTIATTISTFLKV